MAAFPVPRPRKTVRKAPPYFDVAWGAADAAALQALRRKEATPDQQARALDWIIQNCAKTYDVTFQPDSDRASAFAEGRRFVGLKIVELLGVSVRDLIQQDTGER